jgi:hypothetical protein
VTPERYRQVHELAAAALQMGPDRRIGLARLVGRSPSEGTPSGVSSQPGLVMGTVRYTCRPNRRAACRRILGAISSALA